MIDTEITLNAVSKVTGISEGKILSRSRLWPLIEARMLLVLSLSRIGQDDQMIADLLGRNRTTILHLRHNAENYIEISKTFKDKFDKVSSLYDTAKSIRSSKDIRS